MKKIYKIKERTKYNLETFIAYYDKKLPKLNEAKAKIIREEVIIAKDMLKHRPVSEHRYQKMISRLKKMRDECDDIRRYYRSIGYDYETIERNKGRLPIPIII